MAAQLEQPEALVVGDIDHADLRRLHRYWLGKCAGRAQPARADIDPTEIPELLPFVMLVDVLEQGRQFRFRLVGTAVARGRDPTGRFLHEAAPKGLYGHHINALYAQAFRLALPYYTAFSYDFPSRGGPQSIRRLFLPLAEKAGEVNMMLIGQIAESPAEIQYSPWQQPPTRFHAEQLVVVEAGPA